MQFLTGIAVDPAGNVWAANNIDLMDEVCLTEVPDEAVSTRCGGNGFVVFFGLAKPLRTPAVDSRVRRWKCRHGMTRISPWPAFSRQARAATNARFGGFAALDAACPDGLR